MRNNAVACAVQLTGDIYCVSKKRATLLLAMVAVKVHGADREDEVSRCSRTDDTLH